MLCEPLPVWSYKHGHSYWKQGKSLWDQSYLCLYNKGIFHNWCTRGWQPLQCLSRDRKISSSIASPWKSTVCVCCGQDWCRMKMLTHCCLFLVCYFWSAWLSPSLLHCPCSSLPAQQGHCASAGLIKDSLPHDCTRTGPYRHRCGIFYPLFFLSPLVADCCHTQRMSKAKFHSWSIAKPPVSSLPAPLAKANVCTSPKGGGWTILWQL